MRHLPHRRQAGRCSAHLEVQPVHREPRRWVHKSCHLRTLGRIHKPAKHLQREAHHSVLWCRRYPVPYRRIDYSHPHDPRFRPPLDRHMDVRGILEFGCKPPPLPGRCRCCSRLLQSSDPPVPSHRNGELWASKEAHRHRLLRPRRVKWSQGADSRG